MKSGLGFILLLSVVVLSGCQKCDYVIDTAHYLRVRIDPNSADTFVMALMPSVNRMDECQNRLIAQTDWLRTNLDKCLKKLETERGLEPIFQKQEYSYKSEPNFTSPKEGWYEPYEQGKWHLIETPNSVNALILMMNLSSLHLCGQTGGTADWIENYDQRMKRLEKYLDESKDVNTSVTEK
jgi:hypothetical protein